MSGESLTKFTESAASGYDLKCCHSAVFLIGRARHQCIRVYICQSNCSIHGFFCFLRCWKDLGLHRPDRIECCLQYYDANTGYAVGLHVTGHPTLGIAACLSLKSFLKCPHLLKMQEAEPQLNSQLIGGMKTLFKNSVHVYPTPVSNVINVVLADAILYKDGIVSIPSLDGAMNGAQPSAMVRATKLLIQISFYYKTHIRKI